MAPPWDACQVGLRAAPEAHIHLPNRGRETPSGPEGGGSTQTRGHTTPRSGPPREAEKLVEAFMTRANPMSEISSRPKSISHEDLNRRVEKSWDMSLGIYGAISVQGD